MSVADLLSIAAFVTAIHPATVLAGTAVVVAVLACCLAHLERHRANFAVAEQAHQAVLRRRAETERDQARATVAWMTEHLATTNRPGTEPETGTG